MVLQAIRERLTGLILIFIIGILIIPFAFVGVSSYFTSDSVNAIALVNEEPITVNEFNQSFSNYRLQMQRMLGDNFDPEAYDQPIIRRQHLDGLIDQELVRQVASESGLTVADDRLAEAIRQVPSFQVDGVFNADVYQSALSANAMTPQDYENQMRLSMILNQYPATITGSSITTAGELDTYVRLQQQRRDFVAIMVPTNPVEDDSSEAEADADATAAEAADDAEAESPAADEMAEAADDSAGEVPAEAEIDVSDEELQAYYDENQDAFLTPEQVVIEFIELDASQIEGISDPTDDDLRNRFEEQKARFITPEARLTSHILIAADPTASEEEIEAARVRAQSVADQARAEGADFAALASEFSEDDGSAAMGGDLDWVEPGIMVQAFEDALYELTMDEPVSQPVQTNFGWHVIQLRDIRPAEGMSFEEAREIIEAEFREEAEERAFIEQADRMVDLIYEDPTTLEAASDELALPIQVSEPFGRSGGPGIAANPAVARAAWSDLVFVQGSVSDPIDLGTNHMVMIKLREHLPEHVPPLDEIRDDVAEAVVASRAAAEARARAGALLARIQAGEVPSEVAEAEGLQLIENNDTSRNTAAVQRELRDALFELPWPAEGQPVYEVIELADGFAVVQLNEVRDGAFVEGEQLRKENFRRRIASAIANQEALGFIRQLRAQSEIEVFEDKL